MDADLVQQARDGLSTTRDEHHRLCSAKRDEGCDCYAREYGEAHQALDSLADAVEALTREPSTLTEDEIRWLHVGAAHTNANGRDIIAKLPRLEAALRMAEADVANGATLNTRGDP